MPEASGNFIELSLIGTGGGYGESSVVHLGNNDWIVIDSCQNPITKKSLPLEYLESIGVDIQKQVKLIVCTHWHDDHTLGMAELLQKCNKLEFFFAGCTDKEKFVSLLEIDGGKTLDNNVSSSTKEFFKCLTILSERGITPKRASIDRLIYSYSGTDFKSQVYTLSPSDYTLQKFDHEIGSIIQQAKNRNQKLVTSSPNAKSVVVYIKVNEYCFL